jgi:hypothetical protein
MILETTGVCTPELYFNAYTDNKFIQSFSVLSKDSMEGQDDAEVLLSEAVPQHRMKLEQWRKEGHASDRKLSPV